MKLIVAVIQDRDASELLKALTDAGHRATKLASTGGFLREGNTTVLIGTVKEQVDTVLQIVRELCQAREHILPSVSPAAATGEAFVPFPTEVMVGGATVFVLDVAQFEKF